MKSPLTDTILSLFYSQRRDRAGRVQPGFCYRLYPKIIHDAMPQFQLPEIPRTPLQELCLTIKSIQLGAVSSFLAKSLQPPDPLSVKNAIELLKTIGAKPSIST
jgi:ATP-dependent RNA helicase DHX36